MADRIGRHEGAIEMHALDERVHGQHFDAVPLGSTTAASSPMPTNHPRGPGWKAPLDSGDEMALGDVGDGHLMVGGESKTWHDVPAGPGGWRHTPSAAVHIISHSRRRGLSMTVTLIWPGYSSSFSMRRAMSFESHIASFVGDLFALHHDPDLAAGLQGERLRDALNESAIPSRLLETFHVRFEDVSPRAWTRRRNRNPRPGRSWLRARASRCPCDARPSP